MSIDRFVCEHWDGDRGTCLFNKKMAMIFLNSVGAIEKDAPRRDSVDPNSEWTSSDWAAYNLLMSRLASGVGGLNLPTGKMDCEAPGHPGVHPFCDQWTAEGKADYDVAQAENPDDLIMIS